MVRKSRLLISEAYQMALSNIKLNKFRSFLTILGIVVGIVTVIVIASILLGLRQNIVSIIEQYGVDNIYASDLVTNHETTPQGRVRRKPLTYKDAQAILSQSEFIEDVAVIALDLGRFGQGFDSKIFYNGKRYNWAQTDGVTPNYAQITNIALTEGRFITPHDNTLRRNVIVIGVNTANALFQDEAGILVGKMVRMNGQLWEIIGVIEKRKNNVFGQNQEDGKVFIPFLTSQKVLKQNDDVQHIIQAKNHHLQDALGDVESILRGRRQVGYGENNDFDLKTAETFVKQFDSVTAAVGLVSIAISCLSLFVGGIGVMNIMLVSVTERTNEIGIRKTVGATKSSITLQFLLEAMTLTFVGGMLGVAIAVLLAQLIMFFVPNLPVSISLWSIFLALGVSIAIGLIFGVLPARKAANLDPIECLRFE